MRSPPKIRDWQPVSFGASHPLKWPDLTEVAVDDGLFSFNLINSWVNDRIRYVSEGEGQDYWKPPQQTLDDGFGDCEDIAILKHQIMKQAGFLSWVLICQDTQQQLGHAVCITPYQCMDVNMSRSLRRIPHYRPLVAMNEDRAWAYGQRRSQ